MRLGFAQYQDTNNPRWLPAERRLRLAWSVSGQMVSGSLPVSTHWEPCLMFGVETINNLEEENFSNISILFGLGQYVWFDELTVSCRVP